MRRLADPSALLPDDETDLLLRAALGDDESARSAWLTLARHLDVDTLVAESHELLASVATTLRRLDLAPADLPRFDGIRKRLWAMNARKVRAVAAAVASLREAGIEPAVTGSVAVLAHLGDLGVRHLTEADVAIPAEHAAAARAALERGGWQPAGTRTDGFLLDMRVARFSRDGGLLSLRWAAGSGAWPLPGETVAVDVAGGSLTVASRADTLAFGLVDGLGIVGYVASRRQADTRWLAASGPTPPLDWETLVERVLARNGGTEAGRQLAHAAHLLGVEVPPSVFARLDAGARPHRGIETVAARLGSHLPRAFARRIRGVSLARAAVSAPAFLREVWDVPPASPVWKQVLRRILRRRG